MRLAELLSPERIRIPLAAGTKSEVLRELVSLLPDHEDPDAREQILQAVLDRESRMSTGIGMGVAIPHGKSELVHTMEVTFGISAKPIDFESLDGEPVDLFFLLVSPPDHSGPHIKALARISRMLSSDELRDTLVRAGTAEEALALIRDEEAELDD
jgi:fructose-specific phosphotransferase system IIA component